MTTDLEPCKHNDAFGFLREYFFKVIYSLLSARF